MRWLYIEWAWFLHVLHVIVYVQGHGRLWEPPSRSSMWRLGYNTTINTDDNELSCGGFTNQWVHFGGRCGLCGDPYQQQPRDNEYGGKYASGWITRTYPIGGTVDVIVDLTANHGGHFEFRLCPTDEVTGADPPICSDQNRLPIVNSGSDNYRYFIKESSIDGHISLQVTLPKNIVCKHCLFQWKYRTGTRWGCDDKSGCKKGLGPQEEFYGCSDISIENVPTTIYRDPLYFVKNSKPAMAQPQEFSTSLSTSSEYGKKLNYGDRNSKFGYNDKSHNTDISTDDSFTKYLQQIIIKALMKYYGNTAKWDSVALRDCTASPAYANNPIVNEWCHQTCPRHKDACKPTMCTCKTRIRESPNSQNRKATVIRGGDQNHVHKYLGMTKQDFESFVFKALKAYGKRTPQKIVRPTETSSLSQFHKQNTGPALTKTKIAAPVTNKVLFIKILDNDVSSKYSKFSPSQMKEAFKHIIPTKADIASKLKDISKFSKLPKAMFKLKTKPVEELVKPKTIKCVASKEFSHNKYMNKWCIRNCSFGFCPQSVCSCV